MDIGDSDRPDDNDRLYCATLIMTDRNGKVTLETDEHLSAVEAIAALSSLALRLLAKQEAKAPDRLPTHMGNDRVKGSISD